MRKTFSLIAIPAAALLLGGCGLFAPAVSSVNSSVVSQDWLDEASSYFVGDPLLQSAAGIRPPQVTDPTGQVVSQEPTKEEIDRAILDAEIRSQILEAEVFRKGLNPEPWIVRERPKIDAAIRQRYPGGDAPPAGAINLLARWNGIIRAFIVASTELPDEPTMRAVERIFEIRPVFGQKLCISVVGVSSAEKAEQVRERINQKQSFSAVAEEFSDHLPSKPRKGDIGCVTATQAAQLLRDPVVFETAIQTPPGTSTGPFRGQSGLIWWVRVAETGNTGGDLESAVPQIVEQYEGARNDLAVEEYGRVLAEANVRVVCPYGQWMSEGPLAENPLLVQCGTTLEDLFRNTVVEAGPPAG